MSPRPVGVTFFHPRPKTAVKIAGRVQAWLPEARGHPMHWASRCCTCRCAREQWCPKKKIVSAPTELIQTKLHPPPPLSGMVVRSYTCRSHKGQVRSPAIRLRLADPMKFLLRTHPSNVTISLVLSLLVTPVIYSLPPGEYQERPRKADRIDF